MYFIYTYMYIVDECVVGNYTVLVLVHISYTRTCTLFIFYMCMYMYGCNYVCLYINTHAVHECVHEYHTLVCGVYLHQVSLETEDVSNLDTVISDLSKAVVSAPDQPYPLYSLASSYHRLAGINQSMQLIETARSKFQDALKKFPKFADGLILYALVSLSPVLCTVCRGFVHPVCVCVCV